MNYRYYLKGDPDSITDQELGEMYDYYLNFGDWPVVEGIEFAPSHVLKACDPIAYRGGFNDWLDLMVKSGSLIEEEV